MHEPRIIVALDFPSAESALRLVDQLDPRLCRLKVGKELFTATGPQLVEKLMMKGFDIFLDLKFHDIPNTVAKACQAAASLGIWMVNVHALGGRKMLNAAREAIDPGSTKLIAVTLLTSMNHEDISDIGLLGESEQIVARLAQLTYDCNLDGVVCSALETALLRQQFGNEFCLVTPGIRLHHDSMDDQKRVTTPMKAISDGANFLVIGRPISQAINPLEKCMEIYNEMGIFL